jgi:hypothetical protein
MYVIPIIPRPIEAINVMPYDVEALTPQPRNDFHNVGISALCVNFIGCCSNCNLRLCITCSATCLILISIIIYAILTM